MTDLDAALSDIVRIREQLDASTRFQGFTPAIVAGTGLLAFGLAAVQDWMPGLAESRDFFFTQWVLLAIICALLIGTDAVVRARQIHQRLAERMINTTLRQFLPTAFVGAIVALVILMRAPGASWALPGLWQLLVGIGIFASLATLPRAVAFAGAWYLGAGTFTLLALATVPAISPWSMGIPFGVGQLLVAGLIHHAVRSERHG